MKTHGVQVAAADSAACKVSGRAGLPGVSILQAL
jgi:hypothetical protein